VPWAAVYPTFGFWQLVESTMRHFCSLAILLFLGCSSDKMPATTMTEDAPLTPAELSALRSARVFFGHQSVGSNLLAGIEPLVPDLRIVTLDDSTDIEGAALFEASIGRNGDPQSKDRAFLETVLRLQPGDVALYKYCFADMRVGTDTDSLFTRYEHTLNLAARQGVTVVAVTMPLTTVAPAWKRWVKKALGKPTDAELNTKREHFNALVRQASATRPLIDLARLESTLEDGNRRSISYGGRSVAILASEYTDDGAHLNERGRRHVAKLFLRALAAAIDGFS
jgi:hypothetical protein